METHIPADASSTNETNEWLERLEQLLTYAQIEVDKIKIAEPDKDLRFPIVLANTIECQRLSLCIVELVKANKPEAVSHTLRTITESMINAKYISEDGTQARARAYIHQHHIDLLKLIRKVLQTQMKENSFVGKPIEEWQVREQELLKETKEVEDKIGKHDLNWMTLWDRAQRACVTDIYLSAYWLFSHDVHMSPSGLDKYLHADSNGDVQFVPNPDSVIDIDKQIVNCYILNIMLLKICSDLLGIPAKESIEKYEKVLEEEQ